MGKNTLRDLEQEAFELHGRIMAERHLPSRTKLMAQESKLQQQINNLKLKQEEERELESDQKTDKRINENRDFIFFSVNGTRIHIEEDGTAEVTFKPCDHKTTIQVKSLLNFRNNNRLMCDQWERLLKENVTINGRLNCSKCRKDKAKKLKLFRRYDDKAIGRALWILRRLQ